MKWALLIAMALTVMGCSIIPQCERYEQMVWVDYNAKPATQMSYYGCVRYVK